MKNKFIKISFYFLTLLLMFSCAENDDYTGDTVLTVSSPSLEVSLGFSESQTLIEAETSYDFTVSLSETQAVDVVVYLEQTEGTATAGEDFSMPSSVTIKKGSLSASDVITIHEDEIMEDTETVTIKIGAGNEANVSGVSSKTVSFNIANLTDGDLVVGMSWAPNSSATDNYGKEYGAYELADLRLLLTDSPYTTVFDSADGAEDESYILTGDAPDGTYSFVADFYDAISDIPMDLDITLTFDQVGKINGQTHSFTAALNTTDACADLNFVMATVTKTGDSYTFAEVAEKSSFDSAVFVGEYTELSDSNTNDFLTEDISVAAGTDGELIITGIYDGLFTLAWGEVFQPGFGNEGLVKISLNSDGTVNMPGQYMGQTLPGPYDYWINGSGTYNICEKTITLTFALQFDDTYTSNYQPATITFKLN
jgi:hypothetical protein